MDEVDLLNEAWADCEGCELCVERKGIVFGVGSHNPGILFLGEAPGSAEDRNGVPFCGESGETLFQNLLLYVSVDPKLRELAESKESLTESDYIHLRSVFEDDAYFDNIVACRPPDDRDPTRVEIESCKPRVEELIYELDPLLIVAIGKKAISALVGKNISILKERGQMFWAKIPGRMCTEISYPVIPILHPSYLNMHPDWESHGGWADRTQQDILKAFKIVDMLRNKYSGTPVPVREDLAVED